MSYTALTYHIIFGTYRRMRVINSEHERELYKFIYDFSTGRDIKIRRIGGMPDHVHILCDIPAKTAVADYIKILKSETSKFLSVNRHFEHWDKWAEGYAAFSVDASLREVRRQYIINQRQHHCRLSFADELRQMLREAGIDDAVVSGEV